MRKFCSLSYDEIIKNFNSDKVRGLSYKNIEINSKKFGKNKIDFSIKKEESIFTLLKSKSGWLILFSIFLTILAKQYINTFILIMILISIFIIKYIEINDYKKQIENLSDINYSDVKVVRGGIKDIVKTEELVVGDIVILNKNNIVPADIRIIKSNKLSINERNITGLDLAVEKYSAKLRERAKSLTDFNNIAFRGSRIEDGDGLGVVISVGENTQFSRILRYFKGLKERRNKIAKDNEKAISNFKKPIIIFTLILSIGILLINKEDKLVVISNMWFLIASVRFINLLYIFKLIKRYDFKKENIDINNMMILDSSKDINVVFLDKIGSIAEEEMRVKTIYTSEKLIDKLDSIDLNDININRILDIAFLNNEAKFIRDENRYEGELVDIALMNFATEKRIFKTTINSKYPRIFNITYDVDKGVSTSVNKAKSQYRANVIGNVDELLEKCKFIMIDGIEREITINDIEKIRMIDFNISNNALITRGFAYRSFTYEPSEDENIESNLVFVGIIGFENPIKDTAIDLIRDIKSQKVHPILITEDNKIVANRLGISLDLTKGMDEVISGIEILSLDKNELINILSRVKILCKITPEIKTKIISLFAESYKISSIGESLADIPSISLSDIGISKGRKAAKLLRDISDVYIRENILEKFIEIINISKDLAYKKECALNFFKRVLFMELSLVIISYLVFNESSIRFLMFYIFNIILVPLIGLMDIFNPNKNSNFNTKEILLKDGLGLSIIVFAMTIFKEDIKVSIIGFSLLYFKLAIENLFEVKNFKNISKVLKIIVSLNNVLLIFSIIYYLKDLRNIISLLIIFVIFIIYEFIHKKWIKSLLG